MLCIAPAGLEGDADFEQARKAFAETVGKIQEERAKATRDEAMRDEDAGAPLGVPPAREPVGGVELPQPSTEEDLLKAGLEPEVAKRTAEQLADQHREAKKARSG